jgi:glutathione S-transferase
MITLYYCQTSYASHKVLLYLAEKKLEYTPIHIDLRKQEHITSDYRNINPNGTVPSLIDDDGTTLINSTQIMERLEQKHPEPQLLPNNKQQRQQIHDLCIAHEKLHDPYIRTLSYANIFMSEENRGSLDVEYIAHLAQNHPNPERGKFLKRAIQGKLTSEEIASSKQEVITALQNINTLLEVSRSGFVIGNSYSIADCVCTATIFRIAAINMQHDIDAFPAISNWYQQMSQRTSFKIISA